MSKWRIVVRSLIYHWRMNAAVALGVAAATAVLTGALLVGSSMRGSLKHLALDRLGRVDDVLVGGKFFRRELADEVASDPGFRQHHASAVPAILFPHGTVAQAAGSDRRRASQVLVIGCEDSFWDLGNPEVRPRQPLDRGQIVLNAPLAEELGASVGDQLVLRLPEASDVPGDSPLGQREGRIRGISGLEVVDILPAESLGRFSLQSSQINSRNAYVSIDTLQRPLDMEGRVNTILATRESGQDQDAFEALDAALSPSLEDYGLMLRRVRQSFTADDGSEPDVVFDYFNLSTDRLLLEPAVESAAKQVWADRDAQPVMTYLANSIDKLVDEGDPPTGVSYSLVAGLDNSAKLGPLFSDDGAPLAPLADDQIVLNSWLADELQAKPGDRIRLTYYAPETTHGQLEEQSADFTVSDIVTIVEPSSPYRRNRPAVYDKRPTAANDPDLTPLVKGVTDQDSISNWDAPFPVDYDRVLPRDEEYWQNHRTTPKAFISLAAARRLWASRFGETTSVRFACPEGIDLDGSEQAALRQQAAAALDQRLQKDKAALGFTFLPVKQQAIKAASGTTPFDVLFLALSFFIIAAALMLVALLFRLGVERRAEEIGTVLSVGLRRRAVSRMLVAEGTLVAGAGGLLGAAAGVGWAWLILEALRTVWVGAISTPFLELYAPPGTIFAGYASGVVVSAVTIAWSVRRTRRLSIRRLLAGQATEESDILIRRRPGAGWAAGLLAAGAIGLAAWAPKLGGEAQAGAFVGAGAMILTALLLVCRMLLISGGRLSSKPGAISLWTLAASNAGRNPGRSTMTIGLMATACFLIVAMSSFRMDPTLSGAGGFSYLAESSEPIFSDLNQPDAQKDLLADDASILTGGTVLALRVKPGDDASCNNLYRPNRPRVLGVSPALIAYYDDPSSAHFQFAAHAGDDAAVEANPWRVLAGRHGDGPVPVVLDKNTAMYSLQLYKGIGEQFSIDYPGGNRVDFQVAGLLSNSIFQGMLLVGDADFVKAYPDISGHRYFLVNTAAGTEERVEEVLEERLSDYGFDMTSSRRKLSDLLAVQNTYLSTFQALGAVGLLLGTFGLATVQVRNVLERRRELALMRATGFRRGRLAIAVLVENTVLLVGGLTTGFIAALAAVLPHMLVGGAKIPLANLTVTLVVVLAVGMISSLASVRTTLRAPVLAALRQD